MTVQPLTTHGTGAGTAGAQLTWGPMANGDTGAPAQLPGSGDKSIAVTGTFGAAGSCTLEGSNDGTNFFALTNPTGSVIAITSAGMQAVTEACIYIRPHVTAGDGTTSLTATVFCRNTQALR